jgi:MBG domain (YGX type)
LIYSSAPNAPGENFGNLNSNNTAIWGNTFVTLPPASVTLPGNRYIFATPATLTVTSLNDSKTYGSTADLSLYTVTGFQAGVPNAFLGDPTTVSGTPGFFSVGTPATANVGNYAIIVSQGTLSATNGYTFAFNSTGLLTVNPQALTITANSATQTYSNVPYSGGNGVTYTGFVNGENSSVLSGTIAYGGNAPGAVNVGAYTIIPSGQTSSNYAITYVNGMLTIDPQALTITANNATQFYNNVPYSGGNGVTYNGFVTGQNSSVLSGTITFGGNSQGAVNAGTYTIIPSGQTSSNYAITYVNGTLTINPLPITVVLDAGRTAANAAGTTSPSLVMNATVLPTSPGNVMSFGSNTVLPYGNDEGVAGGSASQQTSNTSEQTSNTSDSRRRRR